MNKKRQQPWVWFTLDALFQYGFRKVHEEHPLVWVITYNLEKDDRRVFLEHLTNQLSGKGGDWINEDCGRDYPAVITSPPTAIANDSPWRKRLKRLRPSP